MENINLSLFLTCIKCKTKIQFNAYDSEVICPDCEQEYKISVK